MGIHGGSWKHAPKLAMQQSVFIRSTPNHGMWLDHIQVGLLEFSSVLQCFHHMRASARGDLLAYECQCFHHMCASAREDLLGQHPASVQVQEKIS